MICKNVLRDPRELLCCRKHFCVSCLDKWFLDYSGSGCPHCRAMSIVAQNSLYLFYNEISKLKVRCIHWSKGCQWTGELLMLGNHLSGDLCSKI